MFNFNREINTEALIADCEDDDEAVKHLQLLIKRKDKVALQFVKKVLELDYLGYTNSLADILFALANYKETPIHIQSIERQLSALRVGPQSVRNPRTKHALEKLALVLPHLHEGFNAHLRNVVLGGSLIYDDPDKGDIDLGIVFGSTTDLRHANDMCWRISDNLNLITGKYPPVEVYEILVGDILHQINHVRPREVSSTYSAGTSAAHLLTAQPLSIGDPPSYHFALEAADKLITTNRLCAAVTYAEISGILRTRHERR